MLSPVVDFDFGFTLIFRPPVSAVVAIYSPGKHFRPDRA